MLGWIHEGMRQLILAYHGKDIWQKILNFCNLKEGEENIARQYYDDKVTLQIANTVSNVLDISMDVFWEIYGAHVIPFSMSTGWDELLRALGYNLKGFLNSLDALHYFIDHVVFPMKLRGPIFRCELRDDGTMHLHYYSSRGGLPGIVKGIVCEVSKRIFGIEVDMFIESRFQEHISSLVKEHIIFSIIEKRSEDKRSLSSASQADFLPIINPNEPCGLSLSEFAIAFPHHICFDKNFRLLHYGIFVKKYVPSVRPGSVLLTDIAQLIYPDVPLIYDSLLAFINSIFVCILRGVNDDDPNLEPVSLKGSMTVLSNGSIMYMCSLNVSTVAHLSERELYLSDMQLYDATRDLIMVNQSRLSQIKHNDELEKMKKNLNKLTDEICTEKRKSDDLLCELVPPSIAEILRMGQPVEACEYSEATLLFSDIVKFTNICAACTPYDVVKMLNELYSKFDRIAKIHDVYKVETIGDAYMVSGGVPNRCSDHAERIMNMAIGMQMETKSVMRPGTDIPLCIRLGVHMGPVVAGVVGIKMPRYCMFGDTVSVANKMESHGIPRRIHVSEAAKNSALQTNKYLEFSDRGFIQVKGVGQMHTYFLEQNGRKTVWDICARPKKPEESVAGYLELHKDVIREAPKKNHLNKIFSKNKQAKEASQPPLASMYRSKEADVQKTATCDVS